IDWSPEDQMCVNVLALATLLTFLPVLMNSFVNWDDDKNFLENFNYRGLSPANIRWAWTSCHLGVYQPLAWILLGAEYAWSGMSRRGYRATSLIVHAANVILLYAVTRVVLAAMLAPSAAWQNRAMRLAAAIAVALYAVHPLRAEPVAWVSAQPYLPSTTF